MVLSMKMAFLFAFVFFSNDVFCYDLTGKRQSTKQAKVYIFLGTECPFSQNYTSTLNSLYEKYKASGVEFIGVFPNPDDTRRKVKIFTAKYKIAFKTKRDRRLKLTNMVKAHITPEVFLIDVKLKVLYSGKIDNWAEDLGIKRTVITEHYLEDALSAFINGRSIKMPKTQAVGCFIHSNMGHQNHPVE